MNRSQAIYIPIFLSLTMLLAACVPSFGSSQPESEPVALRPYEPGAAENNDALSASASTDESAVATADARDNQVASLDPIVAPADSLRTAELADPTILVRGDYNGEIVADETVSVMGEVNGMALDVTVDVGDQVRMGDLLVRVDSAMLEAQVAQSIAAVEGAQAQLDQLLRDVDAEDLAAAQAAVNAAGAAYTEVNKGASAEDLRIAESNLQQAEAAVRRARAAYNDVSWNPKIAMLPQSLELQNATLRLESARASYDKIVKGATDDRISGAYAQLVQARTQLTNLQEGVKPEQIRAVQAQVKQAEVGIYMAQLQLNKATIEAPMDGVVAQVNVSIGSMVAPGAPLIVILSNDVNVTIPIEEARLPGIAVGQPANIRANAYPDLVFAGEISNIAPQLDPQTRTIQVTIRPTDEADELIPGMFAAVDLLE